MSRTEKTADRIDRLTRNVDHEAMNAAQHLLEYATEADDSGNVLDRNLLLGAAMEMCRVRTQMTFREPVGVVLVHAPEGREVLPLPLDDAGSPADAPADLADAI